MWFLRYFLMRLAQRFFLSMLFIWQLLLLPTFAFAQEMETALRINLAVPEFVGNGVDQSEASVATGFFRAELVVANGINVMARESMDTILNEQKNQLSGFSDQLAAVQIGKILNVQQLAIGYISRLAEGYYITVNLVDVETGKILASSTQNSASPSDFQETCRKLVQELLSVTGAWNGRVAKTPKKAVPPPARSWALGVVYPGVTIKSGRENHAWELRGQSGSGIFAVGPRYYRYITNSPLRLFWGLEADFIHFNGEESRGAGFAGGGFLGGEAPLSDKLGLAMDFGPMYISLDDSDYSQSASSMEYVLNMTLYWNFK